jgi:hypothetical protein
VTKQLYYRPAENLQFAYPREGDVPGLDVDEQGNPIKLEDLMELVKSQNLARLAANPVIGAATSPAVTLDLSELDAQYAQGATGDIEQTFGAVTVVAPAAPAAAARNAASHASTEDTTPQRGRRATTTA